MTEPLRVLYWGTAPGACDYYRGSMFQQALADIGVLVRLRSSIPASATVSRDGVEIDAMAPAELGKGLADGTLDLDLKVDASDIDWADVVVFRRTYNTSFVCAYKPAECQFWTTDPIEAKLHPHPLLKRDVLTKPIWDALTKKRDKGIIYDSDDLLIGAPMKWNGLWVQFTAGKELSLEMARGADLVTVSTPQLAKVYARTNLNLRVVRNAVNIARYDGPGPAGEDRLRTLYYGGLVRLRDYAGHAGEGGRWRSDKHGSWAGRMTGGYASMAVRDHGMRLRTVWLGADNEAVAHDLRRVFDEVHVHVPLEDFPRTLSDLRPDIGLAPLWGDDFDRCKSELHWIEYSAAGAATIAERLEPFDVIHDGVDGLLAKGRQNWSDAVRKLIREPNLRADIAARAKERIALDYDHRKRAEEWKAAFEWASEHRGIGVLPE